MAKKIFAILILINLCLPVFICRADNKDTVKDCYRKGELLSQQGKYQEAQEEFRKALGLMGKEEDPLVVQINAQLKQIESAGPQAAKIRAEIKDALPEKKEAVPPPEESAAPEERPVASAADKQAGYKIDEGDTLAIAVWQNKDLDQEAIVRPDGMITFTLIGDVRAGGLTPTQLDKEITERLTEYIKYPVVTVSIKKLGGDRIIVLGEVRTPGVYSLTRRSTVLEAVAMAGGFNKEAVLSSIILIKGGFSNPRGMRLNFSRYLYKTDLPQNIMLQSEDIVYVPKSFVANMAYFINQVIAPLASGAYDAYDIDKLRDKRW